MQHGPNFAADGLKIITVTPEQPII